MVDDYSKEDVRLLKARMAIDDGRTDEGIEELRRAIFDSVRLKPDLGRKNVERIIRFAKDNDLFEEVDGIFDDESLRRHFFGND